MITQLCETNPYMRAIKNHEHHIPRKSLIPIDYSCKSCLLFSETVRSWDRQLSQLIPTNSVYEKQERNASPSSNEADASLAHSLTENNVMDTSKSKGGGDHEEEEEEEEKEPKLTYDEEYEDEDKHEEEELEEEVVEEVEEEKKDRSDTENGATKKERSPPETSSMSNIEGDIGRDGDYLEDLPTNQDENTFYYYDEYENGNRSRYDAGGEFRSFSNRTKLQLFLFSWVHN